jgi:hypothetical protein
MVSLQPKRLENGGRRTFQKYQWIEADELLIRDNPHWPSFQLLGIASDARDGLDLDAPRRTLVTTQWFLPKRRVRRNPWCSNNEAVAL